MNRREFVPVLVAGAQALAAPQPGRRAKIGSVSWNFHSLGPGAHPEEAIDIIGSLGFEGIELIANSRMDVDEYWTDATIDRIRKQLEQEPSGAKPVSFLPTGGRRALPARCE